MRVGTKECHAQCLRCGRVFEHVDPEEERQSEKADDKPTVLSGPAEGALDLYMPHDDDSRYGDEHIDPVSPDSPDAPMHDQNLPVIA